MDPPPASPSQTPPVRRLRPLDLGRVPRALQADRAWAFARGLPEGARDPAFHAFVQRVDGSPWHALDTIAVYEDGAATFSAIIAAIDDAREEVLLETYILRDDRIGTRLGTALRDAVARGVRVHVLADAVGSIGTSRAYWRTLRAGGIQVRLFHPWWHSPLHAWRRDHRKIIVVDRAIAFAGGMNIGEEYGTSAVTPGRGPFRDTFARVTGAVSRELAAVFAEGWERAGGAPIPGVPPVSRVISLAPLPPASRVLILDARPGRGQPETIAVLAALVGAARERLWITTPYFAPPDGGLAILGEAAQRGVDVRLLLPGRSDVPIVRHAAHGSYETLLRAGVRVFEYQPAVLHAKTMVCDGALAVIGSANLDFRSLWFNAECNLLVGDDATVASLARQFEADLAASVEITAAMWRRRGWWHRALDRVARGLRVVL
ncbi:MAG TPA: phospholipase D-like domain-containing protein [Gemmatimonadaceae bacterium]|nr:phospholipase D-like domain-containing protein [Gemmatimonadaceae bacterium]